MFIDDSTPAGTPFYTNFDITSSPTEIISSNANGIIIRTLIVSTGDNYTTYVYAATSAPSGVQDTTNKIIFALGANGGIIGSMPYPLAILAGLNIYVTFG